MPSSKDFEMCHTDRTLNSSYDTEITASAKEVLYAEPSELETIDFMIRGITNLPQFSGVDMQKWLEQEASSTVVRARNFASFIAKEETLLAGYRLGSNDSSEGKDGSGNNVEERVLCMTKSRTSDRQELQGSWNKLMSQSPGSRERSTVQNE